MKTPKVLLIDDELALVVNYAEILRHMGYHATVANDGGTGLKALRSDSYDVVVLDLRMPGISGMDILREIKPDLKNSPEVIILTGYASVESGLQGVENGAFDYLTKPVKMKDLATRITEAWERKLRKAA